MAELLAQLDLTDAVLVGHFAGGGEIARYIGRYGTKPVAKIVLVGAVSPVLLKSAKNPGGTPIEVFDELRARVQLTGPSCGWISACLLLLAFYARPGSIRIATCPVKAPVKVVWGEKALRINKEMRVEFAERVRAKLTLLPEIGHFPYLQNPMLAIDEVRDAVR